MFVNVIKSFKYDFLNEIIKLLSPYARSCHCICIPFVSSVLFYLHIVMCC
jgi:hypothetical protein